MADIITLDGASLSLFDVERIALGRALARLHPKARRRMSQARRLIEEIASGSEQVYGVNTGFGRLKNVRIPTPRLSELQVNLIRSHCAGVGDWLPREQIRSLMLLRANVLARGYSGVRPKVVDLLLAMLNRGILPRVPSQGSVGASGDLAPLA